VLGVDISADAIASARKAAQPSATFVVGDLRNLPMASGDFDLVVCFEVLEHIAEQETVVDELARVTATDGVLLASSPNRDIYLPGNPHHVRELLPEELRTLMARRFRHVELLRQHDWVTSAIMDDSALATAAVEVPIEFDARKVAGVAPGNETYTVAMACERELTKATSVAVLGPTVEIRRWQEDAEEREATLQGQVDELLDAHANLHSQVLAIGDELQTAREELAATTGRLGAARNEIDHLRVILGDMKASPSWKVTAPLRALKRLTN
jgi:SAM-dependent methyltransferase